MAAVGISPPAYVKDGYVSVRPHAIEFIVPYLSTRDLLSCLRVCWRWHDVVQRIVYGDPSVWFNQSNRGKTEGFYKFLKSTLRQTSCDLVTRLDLSQLEQHLYLGIPDSFLGDLLYRHPNLEYLDISNSDIANQSAISLVFGLWPGLRTLKMRSNSSYRLRNLVSRFPHLNVLDVSNCENISDQDLSVLPNTLECLVAEHCQRLTSSGLARFLYDHKRIMSLDLRYNSALDDEVLEPLRARAVCAPPPYSAHETEVPYLASGLDSLKFAHTGICVESVIGFLSTVSPPLSYLDISGCLTDKESTFDFPPRVNGLRIDWAVFLQIVTGLEYVRSVEVVQVPLNCLVTEDVKESIQSLLQSPGQLVIRGYVDTVDGERAYDGLTSGTVLDIVHGTPERQRSFRSEEDSGWNDWVTDTWDGR